MQCSRIQLVLQDSKDGNFFKKNQRFPQHHLLRRNFKGNVKMIKNSPYSVDDVISIVNG
jgi:hypothetical protein